MTWAEAKVAWARLSTVDRARFVVVLLLGVVQLPLQVLFYIVRSAWQDSDNVVGWLRPSCEHGLRGECKQCLEKWVAEEMAVVNDALGQPLNPN